MPQGTCRIRLFSATLAIETNTFSPLPTSLAACKECVFLRPGEHLDAISLMCTAPLRVARRRAVAEKFTLVEGSCFAASPAGLTNRADYEFMRDTILAELKAAPPVDGVLLGLHGAMVAHGYDDVERDIIERVLIERRTQALGLELFSNLGIDPRGRKILLVKSTNHFMAAFGPIASAVLHVDADGPLERNYARIPYRRVVRPIWPLDEGTTPGLIF